MSFCTNCLTEFKPKRNATGKFCSFQCGLAYQKTFKAREPIMVKKNLGKLLQEIEEENYLTNTRIKSTVKFNSKLTKQTIAKLTEVIKLYKNARGVN